MGDIQIARGDTGKVLSDVCSSYEGWSQPYNQARIKTVTGVSYLQKIAVREHECKLTFRFAARYPLSTLNNKNELIALAHDLHVFSFSDLEGFTTSVQVLEAPEPKQVQEIKHFACYEMGLTLLREGFSR